MKGDKHPNPPQPQPTSALHKGDEGREAFAILQPQTTPAEKHWQSADAFQEHRNTNALPVVQLAIQAAHHFKHFIRQCCTAKHAKAHHPDTSGAQ